MENSLENIFKRIDQQLSFVEDALSDLNKTPCAPKTRLRSLANIITFGRSVSFVIQNLRSVVVGFDEWYKPFQDEMKADELLTFFKDARNSLEKQGVLDTKTMLFTGNLNTSMIDKYMEKAPPYTTGFFIGDNLGGSGYIIKMPNQPTEKLYVDLDFNIGMKITVFFDIKDIMHKGQIVTEKSVENYCSLYFLYLQNLVKKAKENFLKK